jgi:hypothetical protein
VLVIHWKGGQHSELRVHKPRTGEHGGSTPEQAFAVIRSMAGRWSDQDIAASLNRLCRTRHIRSVRPTSQVSRSLLRSSKKVARVGSIPKERFQCLQILDEEV